MYILGANGHAKVIVDIAELNNIPIEGLYDKNKKIRNIGDYKVEDESHISPSGQLLIAIGDNKIRYDVAHKYKHHSFTTITHPTAIVAESSKIGIGSAVMAGATINSYTEIGNHVIINTAATVDHDCKIESFVHIAPNATLCGGISIGEGTLIGAGAVIIPNVKVGKWVTVGAGAVVINDIPDNTTVVGNPARTIQN